MHPKIPTGSTEAAQNGQITVKPYKHTGQQKIVKATWLNFVTVNFTNTKSQNFPKAKQTSITKIDSSIQNIKHQTGRQKIGRGKHKTNSKKKHRKMKGGYAFLFILFFSANPKKNCPPGKSTEAFGGEIFLKKKTGAGYMKKFNMIMGLMVVLNCGGKFFCALLWFDYFILHLG